MVEVPWWSWVIPLSILIGSFGGASLYFRLRPKATVSEHCKLDSHADCDGSAGFYPYCTCECHDKHSPILI